MKLRKLGAATLALSMLSATTAIVASAKTLDVTTDNVTVVENEAGTITHYEWGDLRFTEVSYYNPNTLYVQLADSVDRTTVTEIVIPDTVNGKTVTRISTSSYGAFQDCTSLESITIPESVTQIDMFAFENTPWLAKKQAENPLVIVNNVLCNATTAKGDVVIPDGITSISEAAFFKSGITSVKIPDSVTSIRIYTFSRCEDLKSITIPKSVTTISQDSFPSCTSLTDIYYTGSEEEWNQISIGTRNEALFNATVHYNSTAPETPDVTDPEPPEVTEPDVFESNGVTATADDGVLPDGAVFSVEPKSSNESNTQFSYEINFTLNGEKIQPNGYVTVKIPVPEALVGKTIFVYRVSDSGRYTRLKAEVVGGYIVFETNHFSEYILSATRISNPTEDDDDDYTYTDNSADSSTDNNNSGTTTNPDTGFAELSLTIGLLALAGAVVVVSKKKK
ncbi:MAG: leucine-rich repeat domain-containing protein [Oscillospiraceae bacterium]|nr:leucine-rich repeat domain-containing protein [Oscillospiraceae bacterium]